MRGAAWDPNKAHSACSRRQEHEPQGTPAFYECFCAGELSWSEKSRSVAPAGAGAKSKPRLVTLVEFTICKREGT